ncbi:MFS transporter [Caldovatus sediminis]|uniref:MFS transporter n=1 Tax=Caldovatus sediminis TaxID=2041189 RepID=A0A8J3EDG5_9PROT|nr:tripartite tricarboxylate transporter substrate-binding protein [Caldovatus sediminis]GGG30383.1 MFS transporter [Caldovatus sediminis]
MRPHTTSAPAKGPAAGTRRAVLGLGLAGSAAAAVSPARAQQRAQGPDWPTQTIRYINVFAPGGTTDIMGRIWCTKMSEITGQQFVIDVRTGAAGTVGSTAIARAAPDGTTIGLGSIAPLAIAPSLYPSLAYDAGRDFTYISGMFQIPNMLVVNNDLPARTVPELIALLKREPGKYVFGSGGTGTTVHLSGEMFKQMAGVDMVHAPYRGEAPALTDMLGGRVHMVFGNIPSAIAHVRQGTARALAVTGAQRSPVAPDVPAMAEFLPGFEITSWGCVVGPAGIPAPMVERMAALSNRALDNPDLVSRFQESGATPWKIAPDALKAYRAEQEALFARVIRTAGVRLE